MGLAVKGHQAGSLGWKRLCLDHFSVNILDVVLNSQFSLFADFLFVKANTEKSVPAAISRSFPDMRRAAKEIESLDTRIPS